MKKCVINGMITDRAIKRIGGNGFWALNGEIEINENGEEIYIYSIRKEGTKDESEDVICLISEMPQEVQDYISKNKRWIEV